MIFDYILFVTHRFLLILKRINNEDIEGRSKNALAIMVFMLSLAMFSVVYSIGISLNIIVYNKISIFTFTILLFLLIHYWISKRYKTGYYEIIKTLENKFTYSRKRIIISFLILWFVPIFLVWISILFLRQ